MTLQKLTTDNSVKYIVKNNQPNVSNVRDMRKRNVSNLKLSQKNKKLFEKIAAEGF